METPELQSTTKKFKDGSQDVAGADMKVLGSVCEKPVITSGVDGDTQAERE